MAKQHARWVMLVVAGATGVGGGLAVRTLSVPEGSPPRGADTQSVTMAEPPMRVQAVAGLAWFRPPSGNGSWRPLWSGDDVPRASSLMVSNEQGEVRLVYGQTAIEAGEGAFFRVNASGRLRLYVDNGRVTVKSSTEPVEIVVSRDDAEVVGRAVGVSVHRGRSVVSTLLEAALLSRRGERFKLSPRFEAVVSGPSLEPRPAPDTLTLALDPRHSEDPTVSGRVNGVANVRLAAGGEVVDVPADPSGRFSAEFARALGLSIAVHGVDALGRRAEIDRPSLDHEARAAELEAVVRQPITTMAFAPESTIARAPGPPSWLRDRTVNESTFVAVDLAKEPKTGPAGNARPRNEGKKTDAAREVPASTPAIDAETGELVPLEKREMPAPPKLDEPEDDEVRLQWD